MVLDSSGDVLTRNTWKVSEFVVSVVEESVTVRWFKSTLRSLAGKQTKI